MNKVFKKLKLKVKFSLKHNVKPQRGKTKYTSTLS